MLSRRPNRNSSGRRIRSTRHAAVASARAPAGTAASTSGNDRSRGELRSVHKNLAGFTTMVFPSPRRFVINAYSMGAWATGTNTGIAMARIAMVKNTGPDLAKITSCPVVNLQLREGAAPGRSSW